MKHYLRRTRPPQLSRTKILLYVCGAIAMVLLTIFLIRKPRVGTGATAQPRANGRSRPRSARSTRGAHGARLRFYTQRVLLIGAAAAVIAVGAFLTSPRLSVLASPTALSVYPTTTSSTTQPKSNTLVTTAGNTGWSGYLRVFGAGATGWCQFVNVSSACATQTSLGSPAPTGKGFLLDSTALEGQTIAAGAWSGQDQILAPTGVTVSLVVRYYVFHSDATYTAIGSAPESANINGNGAYQPVAVPSVSLPAVAFNVGDKLFVDVWAHVSANTQTTAASIYLQTSGSATKGGNTQDVIVTPGYDVTSSGTPTATATDTATPSSTATPTVTPAATATATPAATATATATPAPTATATPASTPTPTATPSASDPVVMAAGDIACDPTSSSFNGGNGQSGDCQELYTSNELTGVNAVITLGDNQYNCGTLTAFQQSYGPTWGRQKAITYPSVGNHEYDTSCSGVTSGAPGYYTYFGSAASPQDTSCTANCKGYYSYDIGAWHVVVLNSECSQVGGCAAGSPQEQWLQADLAAHSNVCTLAYWHRPYYSSGANLSYTAMHDIWVDLYNANVDVVLGGHDHDYERFAPQDPNSNLDQARGIVEFVVGTGGRYLSPFNAILPNSVVHNNNTMGVLKLTLHASSYDWQFIPDGKTGSFTDSGSAACH